MVFLNHFQKPPYHPLLTTNIQFRYQKFDCEFFDKEGHFIRAGEIGSRSFVRALIELNCVYKTGKKVGYQWIVREIRKCE